MARVLNLILKKDELELVLEALRHFGITTKHLQHGRLITEIQEQMLEDDAWEDIDD